MPNTDAILRDASKHLATEESIVAVLFGPVSMGDWKTSAAQTGVMLATTHRVMVYQPGILHGFKVGEAAYSRIGSVAVETRYASRLVKLTGTGTPALAVLTRATPDLDRFVALIRQTIASGQPPVATTSVPVPSDPAPLPPASKPDRFASLSMVFSLVGCLFPLSIASIVLGWIALARLSESPNPARAKGRAIVGISLSAFWLLAMVLGMIVGPSRTNPPASPAKAVAPASDTGSGSSKGGTEWYEGGTLHRATVKEWREATYTDRLATAADWALTMLEKSGNKPASTDALKPFAVDLEACVTTTATGGNAEGQRASEVAAMCWVLLHP
jgi:Domain of unknown function (DUF4190)